MGAAVNSGLRARLHLRRPGFFRWPWESGGGGGGLCSGVSTPGHAAVLVSGRCKFTHIFACVSTSFFIVG